MSQTEVSHSNKTLFELGKEEQIENLLILCRSFNPDEPDLNALYEMLESGANVLIASSAFGGEFRDTLNLDILSLLILFKPGLLLKMGAAIRC